MDTLRASLEILFKEMRVEPFLNGKAQPGLHHFDQKRFIRLLQQKFNELTIDQCDISSQMVENYYMLQPGDSPLSSKKSIFNVLLHFNREVLREYNGAPVCKFEHLLRWCSISSLLGEDLLTTSYLAYEDVQSSHMRNAFDWGLVIEQDDPDLRNLFNYQMADVHMHLKGSSSNFDLNWLCLMNFPRNREQTFKQLSTLQHLRHSVHDSDWCNFSLYALSIKACAIRYLLYTKYVGEYTLPDKHIDILDKTITADDYLTKLQSNALDSIIRGASLLKNRSGKLVNHDYIRQVDNDSIKANPNCILSGERLLLYKCFTASYSGTLSDYDSLLFYIYLLIKNLIRNELIQTNGIVGFGNFDSYERRKTIFIEGYDIYERLVEPLAIGQYFYSGRDRYVEPRITPKEHVWSLHKSIVTLDDRLANFSMADVDKFHYVLHFIKTKDQPLAKSALQHPRHYHLRKTLHKQTIAIADFWTRSPKSERVVGIDAANSEIFARPEVFAQAFRFLRNTRITKSDQRLVSPGMTYHVGEDFLSLIDGLRAIDEVLHYMQFHRGDRLGHALALGINPELYLRARHQTLLLPKMLVLDDIAWSLHKANDNGILTAIRNPMEDLFYRVFHEVYGNDQHQQPTIHDYYESWLLRGDNPIRYEQWHSKGIDYTKRVSQWQNADLNQDPDAIAARQNPIACRLYYDYHFNRDVRQKGADIMELHCPERTAQLINNLQYQLLKQLESMNIGIESNPTSNVRIGGFSRYLDLPIMKLLRANHNYFNLSTSINTDDRGVFATSIEREYALLACAIFKETLLEQTQQQQPDLHMSDICKWLDQIRCNGLTQSFFNKQK